MTVSGSFEDFLEQFKKRHAKDFGIDSGRSVAVKAPMVKEAVKGPVLPISVRLAAVPDRMSEAAGSGWDGIYEPEYFGEEEFTEVVE